MTPYYSDEWLTILEGDCRAVLPSLPDDSVDMVCTSPPFWGLRDYGTATWTDGDEACDHMVDRFATPVSEKQASNSASGSKQAAGVCPKCGATRQDGQLGLERTPEEYVANLVAVFAEVRRVLKPSGTCWLNLGASFASSGGERTYGSSDNGVGRGPGTRRYRASAGGSDPSPSPAPEHAPAYDTDGTGPSDSPGPGSAYLDLCDGCRADYPNHHVRSADRQGQPSDASLPSRTGRDSEPRDSGQASPDASPLGARESTTTQSEQPPSDQCSHCGRCGACLSVLRSSWPDARACARKSWLNYPTFKPKDMVPIPWMVAMALQADGWYLRSDIIWSKPNPMPESVTDRPTKSHEYLFLLTKSARYYFDADAVRETAGEWSSAQGFSADGQARRGEAVGHRNGKGGHPAQMQSGRNVRSVWNIATVPYGSSTIGDAEGGHRDTLSPDCPVHSLRAIRRSRQTVGDDGLLDHLRSRNPRSGSGPAPMPSDGLFSSSDLDSPGPDPSTPDYQSRQSSGAPTSGSAHESRTLAQPSPGDGLGSGSGTDDRTSRTLVPTNGQSDDELADRDALAATGRNEHESRTSEQSERPDSSAPSSAAGTPDTSGQSGSVCSCPNYSASHFAVFPPELPERCIKAGSSEKGVCPECGAPWERLVERQPGFESRRQDEGGLRGRRTGGSTNGYRGVGITRQETTGWRPTCAHELVQGTPFSAVVLDPFAGSGTVGMVANRLSRRAILIDLNPEYLKQQMTRNAQTPLGLGAA